MAPRCGGVLGGIHLPSKAGSIEAEVSGIEVTRVSDSAGLPSLVSRLCCRAGGIDPSRSSELSFCSDTVVAYPTAVTQGTASSHVADAYVAKLRRVDDDDCRTTCW